MSHKIGLGLVCIRMGSLHRVTGKVSHEQTHKYTQTSPHALSLMCSSMMTSAEVTLTLLGRSGDGAWTLSLPGVRQGAGAPLGLAAQGHSAADLVSSLQPAFGHRWLRWNRKANTG